MTRKHWGACMANKSFVQCISTYGLAWDLSLNQLYELTGRDHNDQVEIKVGTKTGWYHKDSFKFMPISEPLEATTLDDIRQEEPDLYSLVANWQNEKDEAYEEFLNELEKEHEDEQE